MSTVLFNLSKNFFDLPVDMNILQGYIKNPERKSTVSRRKRVKRCFDAHILPEEITSSQA
jgi:hypothetical protein